MQHRRMLPSLFIIGCLTGAVPLVSQDVSICHTIPVPPVGSWVTYHSTGGYNDGEKTRLAITGSERHGDSTYYWFEAKQEGGKREQEGPQIYQMLISGLFSQISVHAIVVKQGQKPAQRAPDAFVAMMAPHAAQGATSALEKACRDAKVVGVETVQVPGGSFRATHFKGTDGGEGWVTRDLPFAMVKFVSRGGEVTELTGRGTGAKSSITETPQPMTIPGMAPAKPSH
ncbi:MAG TPA: hypothetical protein VMH88_14955 [Gemmatimonadales bacterium]|nr:hypothetical protein [Gemmatimonadales bacterium]